MNIGGGTHPVSLLAHPMNLQTCPMSILGYPKGILIHPSNILSYYSNKLTPLSILRRFEESSSLVRNLCTLKKCFYIFLFAETRKKKQF